MSRPEVISKLALYLLEKEPLIYLFIINSDWIYTDELDEIGLSAVAFLNGRIKYFYNNAFLNLPLEEKYFVIIHEAYHIFKGHLRIHDDLNKISKVDANIAEDCIINSEIISTSWTGIVPKRPGGHVIPDEYIKEYKKLGEDAYVTPRLFNWMRSQKTLNKKEFLKKNKWAKIISTGEYCEVINDTEKGKNSLDVKTDSFENIKLKAINDNNENKPSELENFPSKVKSVNVDDLMPVVFGGGFSYQASNGSSDFEVENYTNLDSHEELNKSDKNDAFSNKIFTENLIKQAEEISKQIEKNNEKTAGVGAGNSFLDK